MQLYNWLWASLSLWGLLAQLTSLSSDSWFTSVIRIVDARCQTLAHSSLRYHRCTEENVTVMDIATAGLWSVCAVFPTELHVFPADGYCSNFSDDYEEPEWLTAVQILCILSVTMGLLGLALSVHALTWGHRTLRLDTSATLISAGIVGVAVSVMLALNMTADFLVNFGYSGTQANRKNWPFYCFLNGSLLLAVSGLFQLKARVFSPSKVVLWRSKSENGPVADKMGGLHAWKRWGREA